MGMNYILQSLQENKRLLSHLDPISLRPVEVGLLGSEGFAGLPILWNIAHSSSRLVVQISGHAMRIKAAELPRSNARVHLHFSSDLRGGHPNRSERLSDRLYKVAGVQKFSHEKVSRE